ncbi:MAG: molybdopterin molybdenumtransferase MoeA [Balneolaceae bacterium]|nr:MAG: molybdopterin molybdenumtransferase MoeA [Balneolaceae bacterium]
MRDDNKKHELISVDEAFAIIDALAMPPRAPVRVPVREALNRVLAEDIVAQADSPRRDNTAMDGFVFRWSDLENGQRRFPVAGEVRPEMEDPEALAPGTCARIMTGAAIPEGGDFIVPVELIRMVDETDKDRATMKGNEWIDVLEIPKKNAIRRRGEGFRKGDVLIPAGSVVGPYDVGLVIESGNAKCAVRKPLRAALQVSGSEINPENNVNGPVLSAIMSGWPGTVVTEWPVLRDDPGAVRARLRELKNTSDVIVTTGGISAGTHDYLFDALVDLGAECIIRKVKQKPGKPITVFRWGDSMVINLPGNPVSATATAEIYARRIVRRLMDLPPDPVIEAAMEHELSNPGGRTIFMPAGLSVSGGMLRVRSQPAMRSHLMQQYHASRVYLRLEPGVSLKTGDMVACHVVTGGSISDGNSLDGSSSDGSISDGNSPDGSSSDGSISDGSSAKGGDR